MRRTKDTMETSPGTMSIRILICSANLGNAQPDIASLNEWIPLNGRCDLAMPRPPRFPVVMDPRRAKNPIDTVSTERDEPHDRNNSSGAEVSSFEESATVKIRSGFTPTSTPTQSPNKGRRSFKLVDGNASLAKDNHADIATEAPMHIRKERASSFGDSFSRIAQYDCADEQEISDDASFADLVNTRSGGDLDGFLAVGANKADTEGNTLSSRPSMHSNAPSIRFETNFSDHVPAPPPPPDAPPTQDSKTKKISREDRLQCFDIIVIGMQEATFETENSGKDIKKETYSDDGSLSGSDGDIDDLIADVNDQTPDLLDFSPSKTKRHSVGPLPVSESDAFNNFDFDAVEPSYSPQVSPQKSRKSTVGKVFGATIKAGKVGIKVGKAGYNASKKVTKATVKTAKAVNTLATARDHTSRPQHSAQQASAPVMDGGFPGWSDIDVLHYRFEDQLPNYDRALSYQLGEMRLLIYYNPSNIDMEVLGVKNKATGTGGLANKGGIAAEVSVNGSTRLSFLTAHLEAHEGEEKYATRCTSFMDILTGTKSSFTPMKFDPSLSSHFTFFMGDLNFRTRLPTVEPGSERHIKICHAMTAAKDWKMLNKYDELASALRKKDCLVGFRTPYCNFDPTFKVARQSGYEYNVKRSPSYTDRILFKTGDQLEMALRPILYEPIEKFTTSDHKPIRGAFTVRLNESLKWMPALPTINKAMKIKPSKVSEGVVEDCESEINGMVNRENMHVLVSSMSCVIDPDNYDKIRKMKKAELPNSFLSFVSTPQEAVLTDTSKKSMWKKLGIGSKSKPSKSSSDGKIKTLMSSSNSKLSSGFPSSSVIPDTMKPNWKKESLHFTIRTHLTTGDPIDLSGALLHISLVDKKDEKTIGTFPLNLAKMIMVTKDPSQIAKGPVVRQTSASLGPGHRGGPMVGRLGRSAGRAREGETVGWVREPSTFPDRAPQLSNKQRGGARPGRQQNCMQASSGRGGRSARASIATSSGPSVDGRGSTSRHASLGVAEPLGVGEGGTRARSIQAPEGGAGRAGVGRGRGRPSARAPSGRRSSSNPAGWSYAEQPSAAFVEAAFDENGYPTPVKKASKSLSASAAAGRSMHLEQRGSMQYLSNGPSKAMRDIIIGDGDAPEADLVDEKLKDLKIVSLRLDEALMEGGLEVARIKCSLDIWWIEEEIEKPQLDLA